MPGFAETASIMSVFSAGMISPRTASATSDIRGLHVRGVAGRKQSVGNLVGIERDALRHCHPCLRGGISDCLGGVILRPRRCDSGGGQMTGKPEGQSRQGVVEGRRVSVRDNPGVHRLIKKKQTK